MFEVLVISSQPKGVQKLDLFNEISEIQKEVRQMTGKSVIGL